MDGTPALDLSGTDLGALAWTILGFGLGSIPFSPIVGRIVGGVDLLGSGDRNPGATNAYRSAGLAAGAVAAVLDIGKGALPVALALEAGSVDGWHSVPVVVAPVLGHCYSPWLGFRGGKGVATTYGVLMPVSLPLGPVLMPLLLVAAYRLVTPDGWAPLLAAAGLVAWLVASGAAPASIVANLMLMGLLAWRYRSDLAIRPARRGPRTQRP